MTRRPVLPAPFVPVAPVIGIAQRHDHEVRGARVDVVGAPRADVGLTRLERVDEADVERVVVRAAYRGNAAHSTSSATTTKAATTRT